MRVPTVAWTDKHLEELDRIFPEVLNTSNINDILVNIGKRQVVDYIRQQVKQKRNIHE